MVQTPITICDLEGAWNLAHQDLPAGIKLLGGTMLTDPGWVNHGTAVLGEMISVPNATPETVGVSTTSQRDAALKGNGKPWLMLPGTPGAHIMIPINPGPNTGTK